MIDRDAAPFNGKELSYKWFDAYLGFDDTEQWGLTMWELPEGWSPDLGESHPLFDGSGEYIQAAGHAQRMQVEVRERVDDTFVLFQVGRAPAAAVGVKPIEPVDYDVTRVWVYPNEVFTSSEAATIFHSYYQSWTMPEGYVRRPKKIWPADDPAALGVDLPGEVTEEDRPVKRSGSALTKEERGRFEDVPD